MSNIAYLYYLEKNGLLFLETSALESTNVEAAFNSVLAGNSFECISLYSILLKTVTQMCCLCPNMQRFKKKHILLTNTVRLS